MQVAASLQAPRLLTRKPHRRPGATSKRPPPALTPSPRRHPAVTPSLAHEGRHPPQPPDVLLLLLVVKGVAQELPDVLVDAALLEKGGEAVAQRVGELVEDGAFVWVGEEGFGGVGLGCQ
jgi:hypothetical protein